MDSNNIHIAAHLPSRADIEDKDTTLGPLTPVSRHHHHSAGFSSRRQSSFSEAALSFTTEDFARTPQEAAGVGFCSVGAGMVQVVRVSRKAAVGGGDVGLGGEEEEKEEEEGGMLVVNGDGDGDGGEVKGGRVDGVEIHVNGALYTLHADAIFRPTATALPITITPTAPFTGYAIRSNSIFKPLGGSPAAIDVTTLYRVTPSSSPDSGKNAYHRIKPVQQLLSRGTSGQEENMYIYDSQQQGFVRTDTTARFPAEEALSLRGPGEPGVGVGVGEGNCEELFASAERALRRAEREEAVRRKKSKSKSKKEKEKEKRFPSIATQVAQFQPNNSSPLAGPAIMFPPPPPPPPPQTPPEVLERQVSDTSAYTNGGQGQSSWLNIDLPLQRPGTPLPAPAPYSFTESAPYTHPLPPVPTIPAAAAAAHHPRSRSRAPSVTSSITSHISQWTARFSPRRILAGSTNTRSRTPQHTDLYAPAITLQQLVNECVLVLCLYGHRRSRDPRIARLPLPNAVSDDDFDDRELLTQMRVRYNRLRGFWRRVLSLRGLRRIAVVEYHRAERHVSSAFQGPTHSPTRLLECYLHPYKCTGERYWVEWAHRLSLDEDRYALEFVEAWRADKVVLAGVVPLSLSVIVGVVWGLYGPDERHLAAFVLAILVVVFGWSVVALMAVVSYLV